MASFARIWGFCLAEVYDIRVEREVRELAKTYAHARRLMTVVALAFIVPLVLLGYASYRKCLIP